MDGQGAVRVERAPARGRGPAVAQHFAILVYPFRHHVTGSDRCERLNAVWPHWKAWWARLTLDEVKEACDDAEFFLHYVRDLLFPELVHRGRAGDAEGPKVSCPEHERLRDLGPEDLAELPHNAMIRLTRVGPHWDDFGELYLEPPRRDGGHGAAAPVAVGLLWADALLFPQGIGFLALKVVPKTTDLDVSGLREILHHLRLIEPWALDIPLAGLRGTGTAGFGFNARDLVAFLLQGLAAGSEGLEPDPGRWLRSGVEAGFFDRAASHAAGHLYGPVFNIFSFSLLEGVEPDGSAAATGAGDGPDGLASGHPLYDPIPRALYELATCTNPASPDYTPDPSYADQLLREHRFAHWENWQALALHDNVTFLATRRTSFTQHRLPHNIEGDYFPLYLLTLFQKCRISHMFGEVMRRDARLHANLNKARHLWDAFLTFQDHYWFHEVTPRPQGNALYHNFQRGLDVLPLHSQIAGRVRELKEDLERKFEKQVDRFLKFISFVVLPIGWVNSLFGKEILNSIFGTEVKYSTKGFWAAVALTFVVTWIAMFGLWQGWSYLAHRWGSGPSAFSDPLGASRARRTQRSGSSLNRRR